MEFDHVGIYVKGLTDAQELTKKGSGQKFEEWANPSIGLTAEVYEFGGTKIEFLQAEREKYGLDHLAFTTDDLDEARKWLADKGAHLEDIFTTGAGDRLFFAQLHSIRVEIMEKRKEWDR